MRLIRVAVVLFAVILVPLMVHADGVEGTYHYAEEGYDGTMVIEQMGPGFVFKFNTVSRSNGQMCIFETYETPMNEGGGRVEDDKPYHGGTAEDEIEFTISFQGDKAEIDLISKGYECGMSGYFGGTYVRIR